MSALNMMRNNLSLNLLFLLSTIKSLLSLFCTLSKQRNNVVEHSYLALRTMCVMKSVPVVAELASISLVEEAGPTSTVMEARPGIVFAKPSSSSSSSSSLDAAAVDVLLLVERWARQALKSSGS
jgi:hypothetical protein